MVSSMTGFGRADFQDAKRRITVEIRSVNHRFLEVSVRLPRALSAFEPRILELVRSRVIRGKVTVSVGLDGDLDTAVTLAADAAVAERYVRIAAELKERHGLEGNLDIGQLLTLPSVISREEEELSEAAGWALLEPPLEQALRGFLEMRGQEGHALATDLRQRTDEIRRAVEEVSEHVPRVVELVKGRLRERLAEICDDQEYNRFRLEAELTFFADRADVTEECVRLRSHCAQFDKFIDAPEPSGRKLKFLLEEMHREINTIGSKGQDTEISQQVIFMKSEVEKIREQVLNIE